MKEGTEGGIKLPDQTRKPLPCGEVICITAETDQDGEFIPPPCKKGDIVHYFPGGAHEVTPVNDEGYLAKESFQALRIQDIHAIQPL